MAAQELAEEGALEMVIMQMNNLQIAILKGMYLKPYKAVQNSWQPNNL